MVLAGLTISSTPVAPSLLQQQASTSAGALLKQYIAHDFAGLTDDLLTVSDWNAFAKDLEKGIERAPAECSAAFAFEIMLGRHRSSRVESENAFPASMHWLIKAVMRFQA